MSESLISNDAILTLQWTDGLGKTWECVMPNVEITIQPKEETPEERWRSAWWRDLELPAIKAMTITGTAYPSKEISGCMMTIRSVEEPMDRKCTGCGYRVPDDGKNAVPCSGGELVPCKPKLTRREWKERAKLAEARLVTLKSRYQNALELIDELKETLAEERGW